jgi:diaminopimelate decarboxylase
VGEILSSHINKYDYHQHYPVKANPNSNILLLIAKNGFDADCVSGSEIMASQYNCCERPKSYFSGEI